jgi:hypothetical protein
VGAGGSQEAPFELLASIPAGTYHLVLDSIIINPVDTTFELIWRHADGSADTVLTSFTEHYEPIGNGVYQAQPFEYDKDCAAVDAASGDELVFRYSAPDDAPAASYEPDGDGKFAMGRIPNISLPK